MKVIYTEEKKKFVILFFTPHNKFLALTVLNSLEKKKFLEQLLGMHLRVCLVDCNRYCNVIVIHMV